MTRLLIGGDFSPSYRIRPLIKNGNLSFLDDVRPLFADADFSIINFESVIAEEGKDSPIEKWGPNIKTGPEAVGAVKYLGADMVTLANNHIRDYGADAMMETRRLLEQEGIQTVGIGKSLKDSAKIAYVDAGGKRIAVINCCENEFSVADDDSPGANPIDPVRQYYSIKEARENADYVVVITHSGHEMCQLPSLRMKKNYRFFIDAGADAVVNHHQHCFSGYEVYKDKPIFYGLGNFCFDIMPYGSTIWNEGYLVELILSDTIGFTLHPYRQFYEEPKVTLLPDGAYSGRIDELNRIIADDSLHRTKIEEYYESTRRSTENIVEPFTNRYINALRFRGLFPKVITRKKKLQLTNHLLCESHLDKLRYIVSHKKNS